MIFQHLQLSRQVKLVFLTFFKLLKFYSLFVMIASRSTKSRDKSFFCQTSTEYQDMIIIDDKIMNALSMYSSNVRDLNKTNEDAVMTYDIKIGNKIKFGMIEKMLEAVPRLRIPIHCNWYFKVSNEFIFWTTDKSSK